jgi:hypothetical protein
VVERERAALTTKEIFHKDLKPGNIGLFIRQLWGEAAHPGGLADEKK